MKVVVSVALSVLAVVSVTLSVLAVVSVMLCVLTVLEVPVTVETVEVWEDPVDVPVMVAVELAVVELAVVELVTVELVTLELVTVELAWGPLVLPRSSSSFSPDIRCPDFVNTQSAEVPTTSLPPTD